jgi:rod shape-determining protein MreD
MSAGIRTASSAGPQGIGRYLSLALLFAIAQAQATVMPEAALGPNMPMLPVIAVVSWAILRGPLAGLTWALILGFMLDWRSPELLGTYTLPLLGVAAIGALGSRRIFNTNILLPAALTVLGTFAFLGVHLLLISLGDAYVVWNRDAIQAIWIPSLALNLVWLPILLFPLRSFAAWLDKPRIDWER